MTEEEREVVDRVRTVLDGETLLDLDRHPIALSFTEGELVMAGEVLSLACKKAALEAAGAVPEVLRVRDHIRIIPAERVGDGVMRAHFRDLMDQEPTFAGYLLRDLTGGGVDILNQPAEPVGSIDFTVEDGVLTLDGEARGLIEKRLAGVLAWWVHGACNVVNDLAIDPDETDGDGALAKAVRLVLDKDPMTDAGQVLVAAHDGVVTLEGAVPDYAGRDRVEADAWHVFGVEMVVNAVQIETL